MTALVFVAAAALGALIRHLVGRLTCSWQALLVVNVAGSALLGWIAASDVSAATATVVGVGFCGALTTYSSFALETVALGWRRGGLYAAATVACCCGAASLASTF